MNPTIGSLSSSDVACYLKLDGIEGECKVSNYDKWIEVIDFSHGAYQTSVGSDNTTFSGDGFFKEIVFTHEVDAATVDIFTNAQMGLGIGKVTLAMTKNVAGMQVEIYRAVFENLRVVKSEIKMITDENGRIIRPDKT